MTIVEITFWRNFKCQNFSILQKQRQTLFSVILALLLPLLVRSSNEVICERFENHLWKADHAQLETCFIQEQRIGSLGYSIGSLHDENVTGLWFDDNEDLFYLPENVSRTYPNLQGLSAERCSLRAIGKDNFRGLKSLRFLWLTNNMLERIPSDTFQELVSLEKLYLCK